MTTTTSAAALDADRYLKEVAPHLEALPEEERAELLEDLAQHLREIAAEEGAPLRERLGPPEDYAAELLASAGVTPQGRARPRLVNRGVASFERLKRSMVGEELVRLAPVLAPAWWIGRAYLAVLLLGAVDRGGFSGGIPVPHLAGSPALGLLGVALAIPVSVRLGQRRLPRAGRLAVVAGNVVLALFALSCWARAVRAPRTSGSTTATRPPSALAGASRTAMANGSPTSTPTTPRAGCSIPSCSTTRPAGRSTTCALSTTTAVAAFRPSTGGTSTGPRSSTPSRAASRRSYNAGHPCHVPGSPTLTRPCRSPHRPW